jgi:hypothetical protein
MVALMTPMKMDKEASKLDKNRAKKTMRKKKRRWKRTSQAAVLPLA